MIKVIQLKSTTFDKICTQLSPQASTWNEPLPWLQWRRECRWQHGRQLRSMKTRTGEDNCSVPL